MITLDHMILRVRNASESAHFYQQVLELKHEGTVGPFEILRVNEGLTIDLMEQVPQDPIHLAFRMKHAAFELIRQRLLQLNIPFGNEPFARSGGATAKSLGAKGWADALYFYDPDGHNLEIRSDESEGG